jgi:hypothetical protein
MYLAVDFQGGIENAWSNVAAFVRQVLARSKYDPSGLWYAILAAVVGSVIVAVGGGGIRTMQRYWDRMAGRAEERAPQLRQQSAAPGGYDYDTASINLGPGGASAAKGLGEVEGAGRRFRRDR